MRTPDSGGEQTNHRDSTAAEALARTILLLRDHVRADVPDITLTDALTSVRVIIAADAENLASVEAQHALVTTALLAARSGASIMLEIPESTEVKGPQAPLTGEYLGPALIETLRDLLPGTLHDYDSAAPAREAKEIVVVIGDTDWRGRASRVIRLQADAWSGAIDQGSGSRWLALGSPFGALSAAGLAAGEIFKLAISGLRGVSIDPIAFDLMFEPTASAVVKLAPNDTPLPPPELGVFDLVSGGAIIQSALYALGRISGVKGRGRVIEPERADLTNLNRYALLRRSRIPEFKANDLSRWATSGGLGGITLEPIVARYDLALADMLAPSAPSVLVGVDDIPSRWVVQQTRPEWLGVGATTHYSSMVSYHTAGLGCAQCLHAEDDPGGEAIPTVAFVSHWAGLWLASMFVRSRMRVPLLTSEQSVFMTALRAESAASVWRTPVAVRVGCPQGCAQPN
jgi:hypothetical protein